ncbi:hypothetical protein SISSUDRAFT_1065200 [Sistotremastrum suecicum HHB10207 ss-3]|uniref:Uncharacterized protein n=1 Tax=Sistotremastrum suecicum HHB10207 ss-3 TaxID=1314776 RepID=A0A165ZSU1_9AGAM|nr:hypothetical protein SISSUDRAFT_1065200 [Sistotremastrum suecicum HHB10207 ss-3]
MSRPKASTERSQFYDEILRLRALEQDRKRRKAFPKKFEDGLILESSAKLKVDPGATDTKDTAILLHCTRRNDSSLEDAGSTTSRLSMPAAPLDPPSNSANAATVTEGHVPLPDDSTTTPPEPQNTDHATPSMDLNDAPVNPDLTPDGELIWAMDNVHAVQGLSIKPQYKREFIEKILDKLKCMPSEPTFPPSAEDSWSAIIQLAQDKQIDKDWLHHRMRQWISHILRISQVPMNHLATTVRATRNLLIILEPDFRSKFQQEIEDTIVNWWMNVIEQGASLATYKNALSLLLDFGESHELPYELMDKIDDRWKQTYRLGQEAPLETSGADL